MELENFVSKGMRLQKPRHVSLTMRPEVVDFFVMLAKSAHCGTSLLMVGILEDFYDQHKDKEVS